MSDSSSQSSEPRECEGDGSCLEVSGQGYRPKKKPRGHRRQAHGLSIVIQGWFLPFLSFPSTSAPSSFQSLQTWHASPYMIYFTLQRDYFWYPPVPLSILHVRQLEPYMIDHIVREQISRTDIMLPQNRGCRAWSWRTQSELWEIWFTNDVSYSRRLELLPAKTGSFCTNTWDTEIGLPQVQGDGSSSSILSSSISIKEQGKWRDGPFSGSTVLFRILQAVTLSCTYSQ